MAKSIMIQGTMSNAGKSIFAAALCRILKQDGYRVAPFKSQNMALNSYITRDGLEMGRAQAVQAQAAGVLPDVSMNPILLKPTTDTGSQVIVNGKVRGNMRAGEYFRNKKSLIPDIQSAYKKLESNYDIIVIEGAGSPVELNLKSDDIVNMGLAKLVNSPVIIIGDIDRGGIFAQLLGTYYLLEEDEKKLVKGFVVNKFRGDAQLFDEGIKILESKSGKDVLGVVPYMDVDIEDEDSISERLSDGDIKDIDIVVVRLPKMSNYTDFDVFKQYDNVSLRYISAAGHIKNADMIIIPGTKSTISDMIWMRSNGIEEEIKNKINNCTPVFGICGGYQILGMSIADTKNAECGGTIEGMGMLPTVTEFGNEKKQRQVTGKFGRVTGIFSELSGENFLGYEIHMGETHFDNFKTGGEGDTGTLAKIKCGKTGQEYEDGAINKNVYGSYVHGIFDSGNVADIIVRTLCEKKHVLFKKKSMEMRKYKESQYDKLADIVRKNVDMKKIYDILTLSFD